MASSTARNVSVRALVEQAYDIPTFQLSGGPEWIGMERYDVDAKVEGVTNLTRMESLRPALQALLADRFQLKVHRETKEVPVYLLVVGNRGPKLNVNSDKPGPWIRMTVGQLEAAKVPMSIFVGALSRVVERPVTDKTGLMEEYDFALTWSPDSIAPDAKASADASHSSIFNAIQEQLGLRLNASRGPAELVVIESVERPSAN